MNFSSFGKHRKIDAEIATQSHPKSTKMSHGATHGRLIHRFYRFWALSKNLRFSKSLRVVKKWTKVDPVAPKGWLRHPKWSDFRPGGSQGPPRARGGVNKQKTNNEQRSSWCEIWHAMGRWPGEFSRIALFQTSRFIFCFVNFRCFLFRITLFQIIIFRNWHVHIRPFRNGHFSYFVFHSFPFPVIRFQRVFLFLQSCMFPDCFLSTLTASQLQHLPRRAVQNGCIESLMWLCMAQS